MPNPLVPKTVRLPDALWKKLEAYAQREHYSLNVCIWRGLEQWLRGETAKGECVNIELLTSDPDYIERLPRASGASERDSND